MARWRAQVRGDAEAEPAVVWRPLEQRAEPEAVSIGSGGEYEERKDETAAARRERVSACRGAALAAAAGRAAAAAERASQLAAAEQVPP